jgi:ABC-type amino acid transport substrate-binding protein
MRRAARLLLIATILGLSPEPGAADEDALGRIREKGILRVCADPSNLPFSGSDEATPGFEVELARLIASELGVEAQFEWNLTYHRALKPFRQGICQLFMGLPADDRFMESNPWIAVSRPYYVMGHAIVARADANVRTVRDLVGKRVAIDAVSPADFYLYDMGIDRGIYHGHDKAFQAVAGGEAPAAIIWLPVASWLARDRPELRVTPFPERRLEFPIGAGVRRRDVALAPAVDAALARLTERGQVKEVLLRYGAIPTPTAKWRPGEIAVDDIIEVEEKEPVEAGRSLFSTACSRCHGAEGVGGGVGGVVPPIRNYEKGEQKFIHIVQEGKKGTAMAPFRGILTIEETRNLYRYLVSLPKQ